MQALLMFLKPINRKTDNALSGNGFLAWIANNEIHIIYFIDDFNCIKKEKFHKILDLINQQCGK